MRTSRDYVADMRKASKSDTQIQAVARVIRNGDWYDDVRAELALAEDVPVDFIGCAGVSCF